MPTSRGELYLAGTCLAEGYCNDEERTAETFLPDPFFPGEKMYKSGDIGRLKLNGDIDFLGRNDNQIKINGQRVELDEINSAILASGLVREAVTIVDQSESGGMRLYSFISANDGNTPDLSALNQYLKKYLPKYMLPQGIIVLADLPRTPSGKADLITLRQSLSDQEAPVDLAADESEADKQTALKQSQDPTDDKEIAETDEQTATDDMPNSDRKADEIIAAIEEKDDLEKVVEPIDSIEREYTENEEIENKTEATDIKETIIEDKGTKKAPLAARADADTAKSSTAEQISKPDNIQGEISDSDIAAILLPLWQKVLDREQIDVDKSFFEQGGSSFAALSLLSLCFNQGIIMTLEQFYDNPSLIDQIALLTSSDQLRISQQVKKTSQIPSSKKAVKQQPNAPMVEQEVIFDDRGILLTGATGFFGSHLLRVMCEAGEKVICLVRGEGQRLFDIMSNYFGEDWVEQYGSLIQPISGDTTKANLGLAKEMQGKIKSIFHSAADTRHFTTDDLSYTVNQRGTANIIAFAKKSGAKLYHCSTTSVGAEYLLADPTKEAVFSEDDRDIGQNWQENVYVRNKFAAENLVFEAIEDGLDAKIFRLGRLGCRQSDGHFQPDYRGVSYWELLRGISVLDSLPKLYGEISLEFTPVDEAARALWLLKDDSRICYHIANDKKITIKELASTIKGYDLPQVSREEFEDELRRKLKEDEGLAAFIELYSRMRLRRPKIETSVEITSEILAAKGFTWQSPATIDYSYLFQTIVEQGGDS